MRSLTGEAAQGVGTGVGDGDCGADADGPRCRYESNLSRLKRLHHSRCVFTVPSPCIPDICVSFDDQGALHGTFTATSRHQGYDGRMHGGLMAAIVDASMAQCLMGHGVAGYTADLAMKYRQPLLIDTAASFTTRIREVNVGILYTLHCEIVQGRKLVAEATGRFCKFA